MRARAAILALSVIACGSPDPIEPDRRLSHSRGAMVMNHSGFDGLSTEATGPALRGGAEWMLVHPFEPTIPPYRELAVLFEASDSEQAAPIPVSSTANFELRVRPVDDVPLDQRTLFTADVESGHMYYARYETVTGEAGKPERQRVRLLEGAVEWDVFAADLATGATWGRFSGTLYADDDGEGPYAVSGELAAAASTPGCRWVVAGAADPAIRQFAFERPEGRDDLCNPAFEAVLAAPAHPDAPPVPPFAEDFGNLPPRWSGLDRDL